MRAAALHPIPQTHLSASHPPDGLYNSLRSAWRCCDAGVHPPPHPRHPCTVLHRFLFPQFLLPNLPSPAFLLRLRTSVPRCGGFHPPDHPWSFSGRFYLCPGTFCLLWKSPPSGWNRHAIRAAWVSHLSSTCSSFRAKAIRRAFTSSRSR